MGTYIVRNQGFRKLRIYGGDYFMKTELVKPLQQVGVDRVFLYIGEGCEAGGDCGIGGECSIGVGCGAGDNC